jgi:hypothetical protein
MKKQLLSLTVTAATTQGSGNKSVITGCSFGEREKRDS